MLCIACLITLSYHMVWYCMIQHRIRMAWHGMVWYGMVWYGMVWYAMVWCIVWYGVDRVTRQDLSA